MLGYHFHRFATTWYTTNLHQEIMKVRERIPHIGPLLR